MATIFKRIFVYFSMMNVIRLLILCQFAFVSDASNHNSLEDLSSLNTPTNSQQKCNKKGSSDQSLSPDHVKLKLIENDNMIFQVNLKQTKRALANENLPVWILHGTIDIDNLDLKNTDDLEPHHKVMEQLGGFTTYQEPETSSAAIYFHKRRQFDGMIGYDFLIHELSLSQIHSTKETSILLNQAGVYRRPGTNQNNDENGEDGSEAGVNHQRHMKTYEGLVYNGYPEVLVIVSSDIVKQLCRSVAENDHYTTIVSHVLTLFNGIDMLYGKLQKTNIQINIAGIIIGPEKESFYFLDDCYYSVSTGAPERLGGRCAISHFKRFLNARKKKIPIQSYDIAVFLTRRKLVLESDEVFEEGKTGTFIPVEGISGRIRDLYECHKSDADCILVGCITTRSHFGSYQIIAHEMAHLMTLNHDLPPSSKTDGKCCRHLMKTSGEWCDQCLSWSDISEKTFNLFFSSPNCCTFINEPRSLYPPGQKQMLLADEQCQCYGHKSARKYLKIPDIFCEVHLKCMRADNELDYTVIPMDGTPCGENKVCWQANCDYVQVSP